MRIGIVFMHPFSDSMGSVVRLRELALSLSKQGNEIFIFTPYEPSCEMFPNVHVVSANSTINKMGLAHPLYKLSKFLYYTPFFPELFSSTSSEGNGLMAYIIKDMTKLLAQLKIDLIQVEQDAAVPIGIAMKKKSGLPLVADIHNISSEELVAAGILQRGSDKFNNLQNRTKACLAQTDHVAVVSEQMASYVTENYGVASSKVSVVPPGGRLCKSSFAPKSRDPSKVVYAGLVAYRERVDLFVRSIPAVSKSQNAAKFYVTNKGEAIGDIKRLSTQLGVSPEFFWYNDYAEVNRFLSSCHLGILPSSNDIARRMGTPVKLFNYFAMGLPVVSNGVGGWSDIINRYEVGVSTPDNPREFAEAILTLIQDPAKMAQYRKNCLDLIQTEYNWMNSGSRLLDAYDKIIA